MQPLAVHPTVRPVVQFVLAHPTLVPLLVAAAVAAVLLAGPVAARLGCRRSAVTLLLLSVAVPLVLTLSPAPEPLPGVVGTCVDAFRPPSQWGRGGEELANLVMLGPLGLLIVVLLRPPLLLWTLAAATLLAPAVEAVQYAAPVLGRSCEVTDAALNALGLFVGMAVGALLRLGRARPGPGPRRSVSRGT